MQSKVTLTMVDDVKVVVPDSLDLITPYVLREQRDWFEDEIKFLRRALEPGQQVVDIGANYGLYTLSIAKTVGPDGHVWAFEPATATAQCLEASIAANAFEHVTLERCALSNTEGTAHLSVHDQSELNALVRDCEPAYPTEAVRLVSLDGYRKEAAWPDIDFIKIDRSFIKRMTGQREHAAIAMSIIMLAHNLGLKVVAEGLEITRVTTHGNAWSVYFNDPEDNRIEIYVHTPWHVPQPHVHPFDISLSNEEIMAQTEAHCRADPGFMPVAEREKEMARMMELTD
ncbi:MAG: FkbM family methyltransferase [Gammaproteobacteria bacterium]